MLRLASSSSTRAQLLRDFGIAFTQEGVDFDEDALQASTPKNFVYQATLGKYEMAFKRFGIDDMPLLVADTVVTAQGKLLRKAQDEKDAYNILKTQSGHTTSIITCMIYHDTHQKLIDISATHYEFATFDENAIKAYIKSGTWQGKAGACMVEGFCKPYIKSVHGYESCAMGLSVERLLAYTKEIL